MIRLYASKQTSSKRTTVLVNREMQRERKKKKVYRMIAKPPNKPATTMKRPYTCPISMALALGDMPVFELAVVDAVAATVVHCPKPVQTTLPPVAPLPLVVAEAVLTALVEVALPL